MCWGCWWTKQLCVFEVSVGMNGYLKKFYCLMDYFSTVFRKLLKIQKVFWLLLSFTGEITNWMDAKNDYFKVHVFFPLVHIFLYLFRNQLSIVCLGSDFCSLILFVPLEQFYYSIVWIYILVEEKKKDGRRL